MRLLEFASAEEQMALWRVISDSVWASISQQAEQERQERAAKAAQAKSSRKRLGKSMRKSSGSPAPTIAPKLPSNKTVAPNAKPNVAQTGAAKAGNTPAVANVVPVTNTSGTTNTGNNISATNQLAHTVNSAVKRIPAAAPVSAPVAARTQTNARAVHAPVAVQHAAVNSIMPKASNGSKHVDNWQNNTANKKQTSMNDTHSTNSYPAQLAPTSARSTITRAVQ